MAGLSRILDTLTLEDDGACRAAGTLDRSSLHELLEAFSSGLNKAAGRRIVGDSLVQRLCAVTGPIGRLARSALHGAFPVRAVLFDKTPASNWAVAWHQDRTIAVRERAETAGFGPWSSKAGLVHVEPPFAVLADMVTLRIHLDDCGPDNAPLLVALGSHRLGRVPAAEVQARALEVTACVAAAGDVWIYSTPILHASDAAIRPSRRRVLQVDFAARDLPGRLEWAGI
jgi:hypothetical protein